MKVQIISEHGPRTGHFSTSIQALSFLNIAILIVPVSSMYFAIAFLIAAISGKVQVNNTGSNLIFYFNYFVCSKL